jgi:hypothetical protein
MKLFLTTFLIVLALSSKTYAVPADYDYQEIYPNIKPKFELIAKQYCNPKNAFKIKEFYSEKEYKSAETNKMVPVRLIHIYAETDKWDCKKPKTDRITKILELSAVNIMTHVHLTTTNSDALLSMSAVTILDLKEKLSQLTSKKDIYYTESDIVNKYASESLSEKNVVEAKTFAESNLKNAKDFKNEWSYGNTIHHANLVLGRVKLFEGDVEAAKKYLELAGKTPGSAQLNSFGPNMNLAKELLEKGE